MQGQDFIDRELQAVVDNGGEGLVLRTPNMPYQKDEASMILSLKQGRTRNAKS